MSCERHCEECRREAHYRWVNEQFRQLRMLPIESKTESHFAWLPVRDPKSKQRFWGRVTYHFETGVRFAHMSSIPGIFWELVEVTKP